MATPTPQDEINALKAKIEQQLKSGALDAAQVANLTSAYNAIKGTNGELEKYKSLLKDSQLIIDDIADGLDYMTKSFMADVAHLTAGKNLLNLQKSSMTKLANIAKETLDIRLGEQAIDEKRFKKLQETADKQIKNLKLVEALGGANADEIRAQIEATEELKKGFSKVSEVNDKLNKKLGAAPKLVAGIDKAFSKLGLPDLGFSQALDETKQLGQEAASQGDEAFKKFSPMKTLTGKVWSNFKGMFTTANLMQGSILLLVDALITSDKATGELAKNFNISYDEAAGIREELIDIGNLSGNVALNARSLQESMVAVGVSLGSNAKLNKEDLITFTELREMAGYTNEELVGIQKLTLATGGNLKDNVKQFLGTVAALNNQNKLTVNEKQLLKEVANTSAAIKLSVGGTSEGLAKSAFQAKQFGINLQQADGIASKLLDFESSISNELSAELLTGKDLNLEKARLLALNGNIAEASAEILKQVGGTAEFSKMNRIQQEAIAAATGLSREELAASLVEREALDKLGVKDAATAKAKFDLLVKEKGYAAAVAEMGDDQYANQLKQQSIQERMNQSIEKMKELFISVAEPILKIVSPLVDLVTTVLPAINFLIYPITSAFQVLSGLINGSFEGLTKTQVVLGGIVTVLGTAYGIYKGIKAAAAFITLLKEKELITEGRIMLLKMRTFLVDKAAAAANVIKGAWNTFSGIPFVGAALAAAAAVAGIGYIASQTKFAKGGIVTGEINNATIGEAGPEAIIPLNSPIADKILGGNNSITPDKILERNNTTSQQDLSPLLEEMRALRQEQSRSNNKPVIVENSMNGTKFGTSVAMNTYKTQ
jgi:hypothetical protein